MIIRHDQERMSVAFAKKSQYFSVLLLDCFTPKIQLHFISSRPRETLLFAAAGFHQN